MKKSFIRTIALLAATAAFTSVGQVPVPPPVQDPNLPAPAPGTVPGADAQAGAANTITISRTITNLTEAITIIGTAATEQEKQSIGTKLQDAAPGRIINNQLTVSGQGIIEPSGAERPKAKQSERNDSDSTSENGPRSQ